MDRNDYISDNLRKLKPDSGHANQVLPEDSCDKLTTAQRRRLSDIYNAKIDLAARLSRTSGKLDRVQKDFEAQNAALCQAKSLICNLLNQVNSLQEPEGGVELIKYIRDVEHLRLEFFAKLGELELDKIKNANADTNSFSEMAKMKSSTILRFAFLWSLPLIAVILISGILIGAAIYLAMHV